MTASIGVETRKRDRIPGNDRKHGRDGNSAGRSLPLPAETDEVGHEQQKHDAAKKEVARKIGIGRIGRQRNYRQDDRADDVKAELRVVPFAPQEGREGHQAGHRNKAQPWRHAGGYADQQADKSAIGVDKAVVAERVDAADREFQRIAAYALDDAITQRAVADAERRNRCPADGWKQRNKRPG